MVEKLVVKVQYQAQEEELPLVVTGDGPRVGLRLTKLKLEWKHIFNVQAQESLQDVLQQHDTVFKLELG